MYAERMTPFYEVEVVTTCALDYVTWDNEYPAGVSALNGVTVRRFPTVRSRKQKSFDKATAAVLRPDHTDAEEEKWLEEQGPAAPEALRYLREHGKEYKAVIFMTYLYYLSARGLLDDCGRTVLIPTAHDEWPIYLRCFQPVYQRAEKFIYNAWAEKAFVEQLFPATVGKPGWARESPAARPSARRDPRSMAGSLVRPFRPSCDPRHSPPSAQRGQSASTRSSAASFSS